MVRDVVVAKELTVHAAMWGIQKQGIMGIPGDEDGGGMTAFVVFSSIGLYPVTPGLPEYSIGSPLFEKSQISPILPGERANSSLKHDISAVFARFEPGL